MHCVCDVKLIHTDVVFIHIKLKYTKRLSKGHSKKSTNISRRSCFNELLVFFFIKLSSKMKVIHFVIVIPIKVVCSQLSNHHCLLNENTLFAVNDFNSMKQHSRWFSFQLSFPQFLFCYFFFHLLAYCLTFCSILMTSGFPMSSVKTNE